MYVELTIDDHDLLASLLLTQFIQDKIYCLPEHDPIRTDLLGRTNMNIGHSRGLHTSIERGPVGVATLLEVLYRRLYGNDIMAVSAALNIGNADGHFAF